MSQVTDLNEYRLRQLIDPRVYAALERWANDMAISTPEMIEWALLGTLHRAGRMPRGVEYPLDPYESHRCD